MKQHVGGKLAPRVFGSCLFVVRAISVQALAIVCFFVCLSQQCLLPVLLVKAVVLLVVTVLVPFANGPFYHRSRFLRRHSKFLEEMAKDDFDPPLFLGGTFGDEDADNGPQFEEKLRDLVGTVWHLQSYFFPADMGHSLWQLGSMIFIS